MKWNVQAILSSALLALFALALPQDAAYARPPTGYGDLIDAYCTSNNRVPAKPYDGDCALCHLNYPTTRPNTTDRVQPEWNEFLAGKASGDFSFFCDSVGNLPPDGTIVAPAGNVSVASGESVTFLGAGDDPDGDTPLSFAWTFDGAAPASSVQNPPAVTFVNATANPVTYSVRLTVSDAKGLADPSPAEVVVTVSGQAPSNLPPSAAITAPTGSPVVQVGNSLTFAGQGSDPENGPLSYLWDFGGGASVPDPSVASPGPVTFDTAGTYTVTLTVTDAEGAVGQDSLSVLVTAGSLDFCSDGDGDLFSAEGGVCGPKDCRDSDAAINPGAHEICDDGVDNDCDGLIDDQDDECIPDEQKTACELLFNGPCQYTPVDPLVPANDSATTTAGRSVTIDVLANDAIPDGVQVTIASVSAPANGQASIAGAQITYAPHSGFVGTDSFTYEISDGRQTAAAQVTVTVRDDPAGGGDLTITRAEWQAGDRKLLVEGSGARGKSTLSLLDAASGTALGVTNAEDDGRFKFEITRPSVTPCQVSVRSGSTTSAAQAVSNAPSNCGDGDQAAAPTILSARMESGGEKLRVEGSNAGKKMRVTILDATTGATLGSTRSQDNGRWTLEREGLRSAPCSVVARTDGGTSAAFSVAGGSCQAASGTTVSTNDDEEDDEPVRRRRPRSRRDD